MQLFILKKSFITPILRSSSVTTFLRCHLCFSGLIILFLIFYTYVYHKRFFQELLYGAFLRYYLFFPELIILFLVSYMSVYHKRFRQELLYGLGQFWHSKFFPFPPWQCCPQNFFIFLHLQVLDLLQSFLHWQKLSFPPSREYISLGSVCIMQL